MNQTVPSAGPAECIAVRFGGKRWDLRSTLVIAAMTIQHGRMAASHDVSNLQRAGAPACRSAAGRAPGIAGPAGYPDASFACRTIFDGPSSAGICWRRPLETTEHSAEPECVIRPIILWRGRGFYLPDTPAQPKHDAGPCPLGCWFLIELIFQALLEPLGIRFLVFGCGRVQEYRGKSPQFPVNGRSRPGILAYWHL
jgi:hypothetical protein